MSDSENDSDSDLEKAITPIVGPDTSQAVHPTLLTEEWLTNPADAEVGDVLLGADRSTAIIRGRDVSDECVLLTTDDGTFDAETLYETEHVVVVPSNEIHNREPSYPTRS